MCQAFGKPAFPVDTHIHRLAARWGLSKGRSVEQTERDLKSVFPPESWIRLHLQIIYFGRQYCPALRHDLRQCRICSWAATAKRIREESPKAKATPKAKPKPKAAGRAKATGRARAKRAGVA
jgi:endonuclease-3